MPRPHLRPTLLAWGLLLTLLGCGPGGLRLHTPALWRSGTTGTHPVTGTAKISLALAEGAALEQPLEVR